MEISCATNGRQVDSEENPNIQSKKETKCKTPTVKMDGPAYSSRGRNRPCIAQSMKMMVMILLKLITNLIHRKLFLTDVYLCCFLKEVPEKVVTQPTVPLKPSFATQPG
jgi:hypothetical protein